MMHLFAFWRNSRSLQIQIASALLLIALGAALLIGAWNSISTVVAQASLESVTAANNVLAMLSQEQGMASLNDGILRFGGHRVNDDVVIVDRLKALTGIDATIFGVDRSGVPTRFSTTITRNGKRVVGTVLIGKARENFERGENYAGVNPIVGRMYMTKYTLIRDAAGKPVGIFLTAIPLDRMDAVIRKSFSTTIFVGVSILAVALVLLFVLTQPFAKQSQRLARDAEALALGDDRELSAQSGQDELGRVAQAFRRIQRYQKQLADVAEAIAAGDLTSEVTPAGERDRLGKSVQHMSAMLRSIVATLQDSAKVLDEHADELGGAADDGNMIVDGVNIAIQELVAGSADLSKASEEWNMVVQEFSQSIEGIAQGAGDQSEQVRRASEQTEKVAGDMQHVAQITAELAAAGEQTRAAAHRGASAVDETVENMHEIQRSVSQVAQKIRELDEISGQISIVVETIDELTDQTNLLALNAAIEAARAAEHGRGFAVVADEIRKLAESAQRQTRQIGELVSHIQTRTSEAVTVAQEGVRTVDSSTSRAAAVNDALGEITAAVERTVAGVREIADALAKTSESANGVLRSTDAISTVAEENSVTTSQMAVRADDLAKAIVSIAATAEENASNTQGVSASSEQLAEQVRRVRRLSGEVKTAATSLREIVSSFKLQGPEASLAPVSRTQLAA